MGIIKTVFKYTGKAIGWIANEAVANSIGVDIKKELSEGRGKRERTEIAYQIKEYESKKEDIVKSEGEAVYNEELAKLKKKQIAINKAEALRIKAKLENNILEKEELYREKIRTFSDEQLNYLCDNPDTNKVIRRLAEEEKNNRTK